MGFIDILKKSFLQGYTGNTITTKYIIVALGITCILALYIFVVYRLMTRKTFYSKSFNIAIAAIAVIVSAIILTVQSNVVTSLGMVGALSIIRFRTVVKDPMDLVFLFWSIGVGIICGAGLAEIAIIASLVLTIGILLLNHIPIVKAPMLLVVNSLQLDEESAIIDIIKKYTKVYKIKSRNLSNKHLDMIIEIRVKEESKLVQEIAQHDEALMVSLLSHDGEVAF